MATTPSIRVDHEFVETPSDELFCPVSMELLVTAHQTHCCGRHLSEKVVKQLQQENRPCPMCNSPQLKTMPDLYFRRKAVSVKIYCPNRQSGCQWEGVVGHVDQHLNYGSQEGECKIVKVLCPYVCLAHIERRRLKNHLSEDCPKRPFTCNYCNYSASYQLVTKEHLPVCDQFPMQCPNKCGDMTTRKKLKKHIEESCPEQKMPCEFSYAGCAAKLPRRELPSHVHSNIETHLSMVAAYGRQRNVEIEALKNQVQVLTNVMANVVGRAKLYKVVSPTTMSMGFIKPPVFTIPDFEQKKKQKIRWNSHPFHSHIGGYKMRLHVEPVNSERDSSGNECMGVYFQMLAGEYDDMLSWPFYGKIVVHLINQLRDGGHHDQPLIQLSTYDTSHFNKAAVTRVIDKPASDQAWGCPHFIALKHLPLDCDKGTQYLMNDCVKLQVIDIELYEQ